MDDYYSRPREVNHADRRGFAIGVVAADYGMGAVLATFPISTMLMGKQVFRG